MAQKDSKLNYEMCAPARTTVVTQGVEKMAPGVVLFAQRGLNKANLM